MLIQVSRHYAIRVETAGVIRGGVVRPVRGGFCSIAHSAWRCGSVMAGVNSPPERVTQLREQLGLNRPLIAQYFDWMSALARGDFGTSILTGRSVTSLVGARASITFPLDYSLPCSSPWSSACRWAVRRYWPAAQRCVRCFMYWLLSRCRTCVVGRSAADSVVRARRRIA